MLNPVSHSGGSVLHFRGSFANYLAQGACKGASCLHPVIEITPLLLPLGALPILFTPDPRVLSICRIFRVPGTRPAAEDFHVNCLFIQLHITEKVGGWSWSRRVV